MDSNLTLLKLICNQEIEYKCILLVLNKHCSIQKLNVKIT